MARFTLILDKHFFRSWMGRGRSGPEGRSCPSTGQTYLERNCYTQGDPPQEYRNGCWIIMDDDGVERGQV